MLADFIWEIVIKWDRLAQDTVGRQLINSADSIGANIAEGSGRGSFADNRRFARIARGSLLEVKHWLRRAYNRKLLTEAEVAQLSELIEARKTTRTATDHGPRKTGYGRLTTDNGHLIRGDRL